MTGARKPENTIATPESLADDDAPLVRLELLCARCGARFTRSFDWVALDLDGALAEDGWDGVVPSAPVECRKCGAVDEYSVTPMAMTGVTIAAAFAGKGSAHGRVIVGVSRLWDGTPVHRPTQAMARLRELTLEQPDNAEAFRRLGNGCSRWGRQDEALAAWKRSCELDEQEVDAAYALARHFLRQGDHPVAGFAYLRRAIGALAAANRSMKTPAEIVRGVITLLEEVVRGSDEPIGLMAAWMVDEHAGDSVLDVSGVDLRKVRQFDRLADLICADFFVDLAVTPELPTEEPTRLQLLLDGHSPRAIRAHGKTGMVRIPPKRPLRANATVGRNEPCPCGSGQKYKRCCGMVR